MKTLPSSSTVLKRKAEDNGNVPEPGLAGNPEQGHKTKNIKPTCGHIPGTGNPYRGTMRETLIVPPRALGNRPTNTILKRRESIAKQHKKNLTRNAPKWKVLYGVITPAHRVRSVIPTPRTTPTLAEAPAITPRLGPSHPDLACHRACEEREPMGRRSL